jgi:hypothetical protein
MGTTVRQSGRLADRTLIVLGAVAAAIGCLSGGARADGPLGSPVPATIADFEQPGTQPDPSGTRDPITTAEGCFFCHAGDTAIMPYQPWLVSMMGQSARDPMFWACLTVANQDVDNAGDFCLRCHIPNAFLEGRADPDGSALIPQDSEGINCGFCHRVVNPQWPVPGDGPASDEGILQDLLNDDTLPAEGGNARYVVDPVDARRGPFDDLPFNPHSPVEALTSPFHSESEFCWSCHDVSNPLMKRQPDDTYRVEEPLGAPHSTHDQFDMFPLHRTYSEWKNSYYFTLGGWQHNGRFGGNHPTGIMRTCQDCHMPDQEGLGCTLGGFPVRPDVPQHSFIGTNTWGLKAVQAVDFDGVGGPDFPTLGSAFLDATAVTGLINEAVARNIDLLENATDTFLFHNEVTAEVLVRILNQAGHKVPSGFPDGRRMWLNVKFFDAAGQIAVEHGEFDFATGQIINPGDTKVYEVKLGIDAAQSKKTGLPVGETFHFVLANTIEKDNRIPPRGFSNSVAQQGQMVPVGASFLDGQHWDDTSYTMPDCAADVTVTLYYQLVSREYIDFLKNTNVTDDRGDIAWDLWNTVGERSAPVVMDSVTMAFDDPADLDGDGLVGITDFLLLIAAWGPCAGGGEPCPADLDCDGGVSVTDFLVLLARWGL